MKLYRVSRRHAEPVFLVAANIISLKPTAYLDGAFYVPCTLITMGNGDTYTDQGAIEDVAKALEQL